MRSSAVTFLLAGFGLTALLSIGNAACSSPTDVDSGSSENAVSKGKTRHTYGGSAYGSYYGNDYYETDAYYGDGYYAGQDLADDSSH